MEPQRLVITHRRNGDVIDVKSIPTVSARHLRSLVSKYVMHFTNKNVIVTCYRDCDCYNLLVTYL